MATYLIPALFLALFLFILGIAIGHSAMTLKLRREENVKRDLDEKLSRNKKEILLAGEKISRNIDDLLYKVNLRREIEDITKER